MDIDKKLEELTSATPEIKARIKSMYLAMINASDTELFGHCCFTVGYQIGVDTLHTELDRLRRDVRDLKIYVSKDMINRSKP